LLDYLHEVDHMAARVTRLEQAIEEAVQLAPHQMREVIEALQALRGIAKVSAVTIVAELGELSRFGEARQLMAYSGTVSREHSSGESCKEVASPRPAMCTCVALSWRLPGPTATRPR
jgi:transposase